MSSRGKDATYTLYDPSASSHNALTGKSQPLGLSRLDSSLLHEPVDAHLPIDVDVDVIALHGLNGNAFTTWTNRQNQLWLREFLPRSLPKSRIYTFGYDSSIFSQSKAGIRDYALKLLSELSLVRQSETDQRRRIRFICHSLGGIVCKNALVLSHENSIYLNILQSTKAIVFFGTPHRGSEHADFVSVLAGVINAFGYVSMAHRLFGKIRKDLIHLLRPRSKELIDISTSFTERTKDLDIISFYEENAMPPFKTQIVERSSARIGVPNEDLIPLSDNHRDMCRLDNEHTFAYRKIVEVCQRHGAASYKQGQSRPLDILEQECLSALNMIDMKECRAQLRPRTPGSCEWILSNMAFRKWISDKNSTLLHITGGMGTGKSILTSFLADRIKPLIETAMAPCDVTMCSFFCDDKDIGRKNGREILRSLLYQILQQRHDLIQHATTRFSQIPSNQWSLNALWETLSDITLNPMAGTIVVIIDAIDECEIDSRDRILAMTRKLLTQGLNPENNCIKFLISSRPSVDLTEEIQQYSTSISLDNEDGIKNRDIPLVIQRLKHGPQNKKFLERIVNENPKDLDGMYCCILSDIDIEYQTLASKVLRVLVTSLRPLTTAELQLALAISLDHRTLKLVEEDSDMAIERTVRLALGAFVGIYDSKVQLTHQSAKEFLLRLSTGSVANLESIKSDLRNIYGVNQRTANLELATVCIAFLGLDEFSETHLINENMLAFKELPGATEDILRFNDNSSQVDSIESSETAQVPRFFEYSARYWTSHLSMSGESIPKSFIISAIRFLHRGTNCLENWSSQYRLSSVEFAALPKDLDPLLVSAFFGLAHLTNEILENYSSPLQDPNKSLALTWACRMGHIDAVKALLEHGTSPSGKSLEGGSPLSWVCAGGHLEIARVLLHKSNRPQVNRGDENGRTPLSWAVGSSHLQIVQLLLSREDIDVSIADWAGSPPLFWAVGSKPQGQDLAVLEVLVSEPRVDISQRDRSGRTVLSWAAEMGALEAVSIIIQSQRSGVRILLSDTGDSKGWSPLSWAAFNGHDKERPKCSFISSHAEIIKVLAKYYPEGIDWPEETGRTPLSCAMWGSPGNEETVRTLLQTQLVDVNQKALNGRTPLSYAVSAGRADLVRILVEEGGADLSITDNDGRIIRDMNIDWRSSQVKEEIDRLTGL
ncbi:hypothetical protein VE01_02798 [Pseudogymnoascus verrucosus]|uniref:Uncharacterized protein n=1 Tax=Pseudogymnoascus verrucosus TaxID=342668 RepID=A0A1B8GUN5_9PEZI|nr:uncharacterized protein VE01_02798 [Pseudogymnoascus verrucosus]OBT99536.1 hypothetical protein VE01_02798 [Pseudogymnoascus verrucosus]